MRFEVTRIKWGRFACLPLIIFLILGCGDIQISIESGESVSNDVEQNNRIFYFAEVIRKYDIASDAYGELLKDTLNYNYPNLRNHFKLTRLRDFITNGSYTVEAVPLASIMHKLSSYSIDDKYLSIAYILNDSSVQVDVVNISSMELVRSGKCFLSEAGGIVSSFVRINDSIYALGAGLDEDASMYWLKLGTEGSCIVKAEYAVTDIMKNLRIKTVSDFFEVIDLRKEEDKLYALVYVQSPRWDRSMLIVLAIDSNRTYRVHGKYYLEFSTIEGMVNTTGGKLGIMGRRGILLSGGDVIALDPFSARVVINNKKLEFLPHLAPNLYDSLTKILKDHYYAFTCFSGPTINIDEYDKIKSSHGFMLQNKILKGDGAFATVLNIKDSNSTDNVNLLAVIRQPNFDVSIYRIISIGLFLDGLRFVGKLGGSPLSKKEIDNMRIDVSAPDEFLITTGYAGFGGCGFISADSLLCFAYIPLSVPSLSTNNTVVVMKDIPYLKVLHVGKQEQVKVRLAIAIWTKQGINNSQ